MVVSLDFFENRISRWNRDEQYSGDRGEGDDARVDQIVPQRNRGISGSGKIPVIAVQIGRGGKIPKVLIDLGVCLE